MLECEGYKMFTGTATIKPLTDVKPFEVAGTWLYKPDCKCWYCQGNSYPEEIVTEIREGGRS